MTWPFRFVNGDRWDVYDDRQEPAGVVTEVDPVEGDLKFRTQDNSSNVLGYFATLDDAVEALRKTRRGQ